MKRFILAIEFALAAVLFVLAVLMAGTAHADTWGQVARQVCVQLDANPTVDNMQSIVDALTLTYTPETEAGVMKIAMHEVCPEYYPLAMAAFRQSLTNA